MADGLMNLVKDFTEAPSNKEPNVSKDESFLNMLTNDMEGKVDDETKDFYYKTIIPRLFREAQTDAEKRKLKMLADELGVDAFATGGRVGYQTGGVTETRTLPPEYVEALGKTYAADLTRQAGIPSITTCLLYTSPSPRDGLLSRMPSSA